jgi:hypothetical protein
MATPGDVLGAGRPRELALAAAAATDAPALPQHAGHLAPPSTGRERSLWNALVVYTLLWIFEGAFRKWIPGAAPPLYLARDALFIATLLVCAVRYPEKRGRTAGVVFWLAIYGLVIFLSLQVLLADLEPAVGLVGLRNYVSPFLPLYVVIRYLKHDISSALCNVVMIAAPIEALLTIGQVISPANSLINTQIGSEDAYFTTAFGVVRATGTFSSPIGLSIYAAVCLAISVAMYAESPRSRRISAMSLGSCALIIALGGSRSAILSAVIALGFFLLGAVCKRTTGFRLVVAPIVALGLVALTALAMFPIVSHAFAARIQTASDSQDVLGRIFQSVTGVFEYPVVLWGDGVGTHSTVGRSVGSTLPWIEDDTIRWVGELGLLGMLLVVIRMAAGLSLLLYLFVRRERFCLLTWTVMGVLIPSLVYGALTTQPSAQAAAGVLMTIALAAARAHGNAGRDAHRIGAT